MASRTDRTRLRAAQRYKLFQPTEISTGEGYRRAHLLNVSVSGALMYASDCPERGEDLKVRCGSRTLAALVAWRDGRRFGVRFMVPLSEADVRETILDHDARTSV